jgi:hypothetical protein
MKKYSFTALDAEGIVVMEKETKEDWYISELSMFLASIGKRLHDGEITSVVISEI